ncbi:hypothetical protein MNBD_ACTINO02-2128 [hydrothermal vent metagenome]|uniref:Uncharacterized protein n=1 Tax=hydrothermal vent metagenome TaxID=652676 RepID=A0A3B0SJS7_9ZZZZ
MNERHSFSITNFVLGGAMVGFAVLARYGTGRRPAAEWPWFLGFVMVALGISLVLGALRTEGDEQDPREVGTSEAAISGMAETSQEFQSHGPTESTETSE